MIVVCSEMDYLPFLVIYLTSSLVLPAYFNLLTPLLNQTFPEFPAMKKNKNHRQMTRHINKHDYVSVGTNLFIKTSICFHFLSYNHCFSITKQKQQKISFVYLLCTHKIHTTIMICGSAPAFLNILVSSTSLNILPW